MPTNSVPDAAFDILIVGTGQAAAQAAISLRQEGFAGSIGMVGEEPDLPYERPPLSKEYLAGNKPAERLLLRPAAFWVAREIAILPNTCIIKVDPERRCASAQDGRTFGFQTLVWAAGGHARRLACPGHELAGVHVIRSRADDDALVADLAGATRIAVIGGGYVGLEAAAVLAEKGKSVTVIEAMPRLLARVAAAPVSEHYRAVHAAKGVTILLDSQVEALEGEGRVSAVRLANGERIETDLVIAGIGLVPSIGPLAEAAAAVQNGILVDSHSQTSLPGIYAIGDCAAHPNRFAAGTTVRLESVQNAVDMAKAAAAHIVHGEAAKPYDACPWFWSNQYDLKLQTVGLSSGHDETVVRGDPDTGSWSLVYLRAGQVIALDCISAPRDYVQGKALVQRGARISPALLADATVPLKLMEG